jgi:hypothetical protein
MVFLHWVGIAVLTGSRAPGVFGRMMIDLSAAIATPGGQGWRLARIRPIRGASQSIGQAAQTLRAPPAALCESGIVQD